MIPSHIDKLINGHFGNHLIHLIKESTDDKELVDSLELDDLIKAFSVSIIIFLRVDGENYQSLVIRIAKILRKRLNEFEDDNYINSTLSIVLCHMLLELPTLHFHILYNEIKKTRSRVQEYILNSMLRFLTVSKSDMKWNAIWYVLSDPKSPEYFDLNILDYLEYSDTTAETKVEIILATHRYVNLHIEHFID